MRAKIEDAPGRNKTGFAGGRTCRFSAHERLQICSLLATAAPSRGESISDSETRHSVIRAHLRMLG